MTTLLETQRAFRTALLSGDATMVAPGAVAGGAGPSPARRMAVYRANVVRNLTGVLRLAYPAVDRLVGEAFFDLAAEMFVRTAPPVLADLYAYGDDFADFLAAFAPAATLPYLPDVARLEWAVGQALHASPAGVLHAAALAGVDADRQAAVRLVPHPSLTLLATRHPARAIWEAVMTEDAAARDARLAAVDPAAGGETLAVLCPAGRLVVAALPAPVHALARSLVAGTALGDLPDDGDPAATGAAIAGLIADGFFCDLRFDIHAAGGAPREGEATWH